MADASLLCLRIDWNRTAVQWPGLHYFPFHHLCVDPEPGYPFGRKGLALATAWQQLAAKDTDGLLLLDGDVAIDPADLAAMYGAINSARQIVHTAPVKLWPRSTKWRTSWVWGHMTGMPPEQGQDDLGDEHPGYRFSFCFTYLPRELVAAAIRAGLRQWQYPHCDEKVHQLAARMTMPVRLVRGATPKHLNY
jgi:hypothetical protein